MAAEIKVLSGGLDVVLNKRLLPEWLQQEESYPMFFLGLS